MTQLDHLIAQVSGHDLFAHLRAFARWTKHAGTPEERSSLEYVRDTIAGYGYRTQIIDHDAYVSLPGHAGIEALGSTLVCIAHSFSQPSPAGGLVGELIYLEDPTRLGPELAGRLVLLDGIANPGAALRASEAGVAGLVHISPDRYRHEMCVSPVWGSPTHASRDRLPSCVVVSVANREGEALKAAARAGAAPIVIHAEVDTGWRTTPLLVAELPSVGGDDDEPFVLFSGHHDAWYYGVMDNGGANATMLEVARLCAAARGSWRRGLRLAFWSGHSQGRYSGSTWYADHHWEELDRRAVAHVNVDSTGGRGNTVVADGTACAELGGLAREAIAERAGQVFSGRRMARAGDQSFWGIGLPSIFMNLSERPASDAANPSAAIFGASDRLGHGTGWTWHTPADLLDTMDEAILVRDTQVYLHVVWRLLTEAVLPIDYAAYASYLQVELETMVDRLGDHLDLSLLRERARSIEIGSERLAALSEASTDPPTQAAINRCIVALSRLLVPLDYTVGDRFEHDPALMQSPFPALVPALELVDLDPAGDDYKFLRNGVIRARNRVAWALREAADLLLRTLEALGAPPNPGERS